MNILILLGILLVIIFIIYIVFSYIIRAPGSFTLVTDKKLALSKEQRVLNSDDSKRILLSSSSASVMIYIYLEQGNKTATDSKPSIIKQDGVWAVTLNNNGTPILSVKTLNGVEDIILPVISYQKWVAVTIVRDGRRMDIYYNGELVLSHRMKAYIYNQLSPLNIGSTMLQGSASHIYVASRAYNRQEIYDLYKQTSDTRGRPYIKNDTPLIPTIGCPSGPLCFSASAPPPNPYKKWVTQYS